MNNPQPTKEDLLPSLITDYSISDWITFFWFWTTLAFLAQAPIEILAQWILLYS